MANFATALKLLSLCLDRRELSIGEIPQCYRGYDLGVDEVVRIVGISQLAKFASWRFEVRKSLS
jgi:hypothetical protein